MRHYNYLLRTLIAGCALVIAGAACAQSDSDVDAATARKQAMEIAKGSPARWFVADRTDTQRLRTLHKEIGAALNEALAECRKRASSERAACNKEARATYLQDMNNAPELMREAKSN
jgi:hypothetical protein